MKNHYESQIDELGLPRDTATIRCEGKHRDLKNDCKLVSSRRNICKTIAVKNQLRLNYRFLLQRGLQKTFAHGPQLCENVILLRDFKCFRDKITDLIKEKYKPVSWVLINSVCYKLGLIILLHFDKKVTKFGQLKYFLINENTEDVIFVCTVLNSKKYCKHFCGYEVERSKEWCLISYNDMKYSNNIFNVCKLNNNKEYVSCEF